MKNRINILLLLIGFCLTSLNSYSQENKENIDDLRNVANNYFKLRSNKAPITMELLKSATKTTYSFNNFPCSDPTFEYQGYIYVTPESVTLEVYNNSSQLCFNQSHKITREKYSKFLQDLYALKIELSDDAIPSMGGGEDKITIQENDNILFEGILDLDFVITTVNFIDKVFEPLLDSNLRAVFRDPYITLNPSQTF